VILKYIENENVNWNGVNPFEEIQCVISVYSDDENLIETIDYFELDSEIRLGLFLHEHIMILIEKYFGKERFVKCNQNNIYDIVEQLRLGKIVYLENK
jgi:hypothetical protein